MNVVTPVGDPHSYYGLAGPRPGMGNKEVHVGDLPDPRTPPPLLVSASDQQGGGDRRRIDGRTRCAGHRDPIPHMYTAVGGFSDCANISSPENQFLTQWDISRGGGTRSTWGKFTDPAWRCTPSRQRRAVGGQDRLPLSSGSGMPGTYNNVAADPLDTTVKGAFLEFGGAVLRRPDDQSAQKLGIPFQGSVKASGTTAGSTGATALFTAWPVLMKALDAHQRTDPEAPSSGLADGLGSSQKLTNIRARRGIPPAGGPLVDRFQGHTALALTIQAGFRQSYIT